ncbi:MAG: hypothetical protein ACOYXT_08775 [Bacteroidota bacterium]
MATWIDQALRAIEVKYGYPNAGAKGYFHGWFREPCYDDSGRAVPKTFALVELQDGDVVFVEPTTIKFTKPYSQENKKKE